MSEAIRIYRNMLRASKSLPQKQKDDIIQQIRTEFRRTASNSDPIVIENSIKKANDSLGYLKMITPRGRGQTGKFRKVYGVGTEDVNGTARGPKAVTNWHGSNLDPDSRAKHFKLLERAGFKDNAHAKGIF